LPEAGLWPTPTTAQKKRARHMKAKEATGRITKTVQQQWGDSRQKPPVAKKQPNWNKNKYYLTISWEPQKKREKETWSAR